MAFVRSVVAFLGVLSLASARGGCKEQEDERLDVTMRSDGYALFAVDNERQQQNDVAITVRDVDPGATYVLLYSRKAPQNVGWFAFDPTTRERCGGDTGSHCSIDGYGYMVDAVTAAGGASEITLRDQRCGCDGDNDSKDWTGHWAVMRVERTGRTNRVAIDVHAKEISGYASDPKIAQLQ